MFALWGPLIPVYAGRQLSGASVYCLMIVVTARTRDKSRANVCARVPARFPSLLLLPILDCFLQTPATLVLGHTVPVFCLLQTTYMRTRARV